MLSILNMLDMTRRTVWFVFGNQDAIGCQLNAAVVAIAAGRPRSFPVDRIEGIVATRARQFTFRISV